MSESKHTPGPLRAECFAIYDSKGRMLGQLGTSCDRDVPAEECEANASLFSAAPELLEALKMFRDASQTHFAEWHEKYHPAIEKALAAIAKAEAQS